MPGQGVGHGTAGTWRGKDTGGQGHGSAWGLGSPGMRRRAGHPPLHQKVLFCPEEEEKDVGEGWKLSRCRCPSHRVACGHRVTAEHVDPPCRSLGPLG